MTSSIHMSPVSPASSLLLAVLALLVAAAPTSAQGPKPFVEDTLTTLEAAVGSPVRATVSPKTGLVTFLSFAEHQRTLGKLPGTAPAEQRARAFLAAYGAAFGASGADQMSLKRVTGADEVGMEHVRFRQTHQGVPITGGELTVHLRGSAVVAVNAKTLSDLDTVDTTPLVSAAEAAVLAADALAQGLGVTDATLSEPRLELLNKGHLGGRGFATGLAWFIEARKIDLREYIWIDALAGKVVLQFSQLTDAKDREIYDTNSTSTLPGTLVRSEGGAVTGDPDADAAYDYSGDTYDYFFNEHGRDSYDGAGATIISTVEYCSPTSCPLANAFWNGTQMVYGAGFSLADDVDAHELTHAVTERTANLFYYMQSGALNESFSDIFGEAMDFGN
ncbi:MAG: M4 family metallopeptidase, partial [bacterium]|nr:M4 family metallopeptidase [bacterium]